MPLPTAAHAATLAPSSRRAEQRAKKIKLLSLASVNGCYRRIEAIHAVTERKHDSTRLSDGSETLAPMGALTLLGPRRGATACRGRRRQQAQHKEQRPGEQPLTQMNI